jgi:hypothetical protein
MAVVAPRGFCHKVRHPTENDMAAESRLEHTDPSRNAMDYPEHERTYSLFLGLAKWVSIAVVVVVAGMALFLVSPPRHAGAPAGQAPAAQAAH